MNEINNPFFLKLLSRFTYPQKFLIISFFFGFSVFISSFFLVRAQQKGIDTVLEQMKGLKYQTELNRLQEKLVYHELKSNEYLQGNTTLRSEIENLQTQINTQFQSFEQIDKTYNSSAELAVDGMTYPLKNIIAHWNKISQNIWEKEPQENMQLHYMLIKELKNHVTQTTKNSAMVLAYELDSYYLATLLVDLLPQAEADIPQMIILSNLLYENQSTHRDVGIKLASFSYILNANLEKIKIAYKIIVDYDKPTADIIKAFDDYFIAINNLTQTIYDNIVEPLETKKPEVSISDLGKIALGASFNLWFKTSELMENLLNDDLKSIKKELFYTLSLTISGSLLGLLLGYLIMKQINIPLMQLASAAQRLAQGDLSTRVPVLIHDEVGNVSEAFNQMIESLQELIGRLQWTGIQLTTSTTEISAAAKQQESSIVEQEATTKQIAVTAKEISTTAKDFARTMSEVSSTAEQTSALAASGRDGLRQMEDTMGHMVEASKTIASKLAVLSEKAGNITSVITTITKVADQTNLLSLNAAIEAEKAGEHGRSFSVIAKEIRRLADQTANATLDIEKTVNEIVSAVSAGVMGVDKFSEVIHSGVFKASVVGEQLTKIIEQVQLLTKSFEAVNQGMQAQSLGAEQINESISQLSDTARQTTESILHFHKAIEELNNAAQEMQSAVAKIKR